MKGFFTILTRFLPPYKRFLALNILFNLLTAILTLFSFALIIPILEMLFGINQETYSYIAFGDASVKDVVVNNFYYYTQVIIQKWGASWALAALSVALVIMTALKTGAAYVSSVTLVPIRAGVVRDIRDLIYAKIMALPMGFFSEERKGDVMARMSGDVAEVENSIMASLEMLFKNPVMIVACLGMMIALSWQLTVFVLILLPVAGFIMGQVGKRLKRVSLEGQNQWGVLLSNIEESLGGLRIIKAFCAEEKAKSRFGRENNHLCYLTSKREYRYNLAHPMSEFLGTATIAIVLWFGGALIISGTSSISAASFIYYMVIFYSIINPAKDLSRASYSIQKGLASMQRIDKILDAKNPITDPAKPETLTALGKEILYDDVTFNYSADGPEVISNVTLRIPAGSTVALVGQSGSGKSTLADLLPRFYDVTGGKITIDGTDIRNVRLADLRHLMGNVNQEAILFNDSFLGNITFGVEEYTMDEVINAAKVANAYEFITASENGFDTNIGDRGCRLSGGQRQRISIARAILKNPPILILDEATSALDTESEQLVQEALNNLMKGRTTLVIAHRLSTIKNADLICVMHEGKIVEQGTHQQLLDLQGHYYRLVQLQQF